MLRLITDHPYKVPVHGEWAFLERVETGKVNAVSVGIYRFYADSAATFSKDPVDLSFERAAKDLFKLVKLANNRPLPCQLPETNG
ncbi:hypothetical protein [Arthrobacter sp. OV608]|uniref:hypothetical protein n=1 Tax=Arthrobacter sp. OV608 TaxID=1882768 RepID=UPI0008D2DFD1|nr:hypothetical protein [Arthrobacter sp. OV608]SEQ79620.1 hypothetical protein SAMN05444745_11135 [Arthrobacter sp. OV608]